MAALRCRRPPTTFSVDTTEEEARAEGLRDAAQRALNNAKSTRERLCPEESSIFRPGFLIPVAIVGLLLVGTVTSELVFHFPINFTASQSAGSSGGQGTGGNQAKNKPSDPAQFFKSAFGASDNWQVISLRKKEMITVNGKTNETNGDETDSKNPLFVYGSNTVGTQVFKYFRRGSNGDSCTTSAAGKLFFFPGTAPVPGDAFDPYGILPKITAQKLEPDGPAPAGLGVDGTFWKGIGEYPLPEGLPPEHKIMNHTFEIYLDPATLQVKVMVQDTTATDTSNGQSQQTHDVVNYYGFNPNAVANPPDCKKQ